MKTKYINLSSDQKKILLEFIQGSRPSSKQYSEFQKRIKLASLTKKPKPNSIPNTVLGFGSGNVKLLEGFDAKTDLPEGLAVSSLYDSGGNFGIELAGLMVLRHAWNYYWTFQKSRDLITRLLSVQ